MCKPRPIPPSPRTRLQLSRRRAIAGRRRLRHSNNDYDWLGPGIYFWEANPLRGLEFAEEASKRKPSNISKPFVIDSCCCIGSAVEQRGRASAKPRLCRGSAIAHDSRNAEATRGLHSQGRLHGRCARISRCGISRKDSYSDRGSELSMHQGRLSCASGPTPLIAWHVLNDSDDLNPMAFSRVAAMPPTLPKP